MWFGAIVLQMEEQILVKQQDTATPLIGRGWGQLLRVWLAR